MNSATIEMSALQEIANGEHHRIPATIDDPEIHNKIEESSKYRRGLPMHYSPFFS
jgi:hypothetical protein